MEVVRGADSAPETIERTTDFLTGAGKRPIVVKDCPGFLVNRILGVYMNEALYLLQTDAGITDMEKAARLLGLPMGPVKLGDMVGWDVIHASNRTLAIPYGERFALPPLLIRLESGRRLGAKRVKASWTTALPLRFLLKTWFPIHETLTPRR